MEKRIVIFLLLSLAVVQFTMLYTGRNAPKQTAAPGIQTATTGTLTAATPQPSEIRAAPIQSTPEPRKAESLPPVKTITRKTNSYEIEFSPRGAVPVRWDIVDKKYVVAPTAEDGSTSPGAVARELLIDPHLSKISGGAMPFQLVLRERNTSYFRNEINQQIYASADVDRDGMKGIRFSATSPQAGLRIAKTWLFRPEGGFTGRFSVELTNVTSSTLAYDNGVGGLGIVLGPGLGTPDSVKGTLARWAVVDAVLKTENSFLYERPSKPGIPESTNEKLTWGGLQSLYFLGILIPPDEAPFHGAQTMLGQDLVPTVATEKNIHLFPQVELYTESFEIAPGQSREFKYEFYFGPKEHKLLAATRADLKRVLFHDSYGWFRPIVLALLYMLELFHKMTMSWGVSIILLTIFVRIVAFPLVHKGMKAQAVMMEQQKKLKPYMDKINEKYKNDPAKKQQEVMKLYKEHNMNPLSMFKGCIWMMIQIPIFVALYKLLYSDINLRGQAFMWFNDLSQPDQIFQFGFTVPLLGWTAFNLLPFITAATQMAASKFTQTSVATDAQQAEMQKMMIYLMPIMILVITYGFPSGLMLYWLVSNVWQVLQQLWVNKHIHGAKKPAPARAGARG